MRFINVRRLKILVGISGGVDSAVSAYLLKQRGFNVCGVHVRNWDNLDESGVCVADQELAEAQLISNKLNIDLIETECIREYWNEVFEPFLVNRENGLGFNIDQALVAII